MLPKLTMWTARQSVDLSRFVKRHELVAGDSVMGLALRYSVDVPQLKRLNNLITDHTLVSRSHIYIPGTEAFSAFVKTLRTGNLMS